MTIRRDINELAEKSLLVKIYGGAQKLEKIEQELSTQEKSIPMCRRKNSLEK